MIFVLLLHPPCGLNGVFRGRALPPTQEGEEGGGGGVMGLSEDCLFVVFTAKPFRTQALSSVLSHTQHILPHLFTSASFFVFLRPISPRGKKCDCSASHISICKSWLASLRDNRLPFDTHLHEEQPSFARSVPSGGHCAQKSQITSAGCAFLMCAASADDWRDGRYLPAQLEPQTKPPAYSMYGFI